MDKRLIEELKATFDDIMRKTDDGIEYWSARDLYKIFGYTEYNKFVPVIKKAMLACENSGFSTLDHFADVSEMVTIGSGATRKVQSYHLTRYACYLIAQNGDPRKDEIAFAQSYFAVQTRKAEIIEQRLAELNRLQLRDQLKTSEKRLSQNIFERGVDERGFGRIRSKGDAALFSGKSTQDMKNLYGIKSGALADRLPAVTLAAKNLATEMTNLNVEEKDLFGEPSITTEHVQNNTSVRNMLGERGIKPEKLPPDEDTKKIERRLKTEEKEIAKINNK